MATVLVAGVLCATQLPNVPFSDTSEYADCLLAFVRSPTMAALDCADHPTRGWFAYLVLPVLMLGERPEAPVFANLGALGLLAGAVHAALSRIPGVPSSVRLLATLAVGVQPVVLAGLVQWGPDTGLALIVFPYLWCLARRRWIAATVLAALLAGTKETGWLIVLSAGGLAGILALRDGPRDRIGALVSVTVPAGLALAWLRGRGGEDGMNPGTGKTGLLWNGLDMADLVDPAQRSANLLGLGLTHFLNAAVLQFGWLLLPFAVMSLWRRLRRATRGGAESFDRLILLWAALWLIVPVLAVLPVHAPPRYVAFLLPGYLVAAVDGALGLGSAPVLVGLGALVVLWTGACFRTLDPVSKAVFGTFAFGDHVLLNMTRWSRDWPGPGEDQLAYNFEWLRIPRLVDDALADLRPPPDALLVFPPNASWRVVHRVDPRTHTRTWSTTDGAYVARVLGEVTNPFDSYAGRVYGFDLPNGVQPDFAGFLGKWARPERVLRYEADGYWIDVVIATGNGS